jgi:monoamine oxidase
MDKFDICIIGAGLAGLSSAYNILKKNRNIKVLLIEARERVGGKTHTIHINNPNESVSLSEKDMNELAIDVGGQWIGYGHARAIEIIERHSMEMVEQFYPDLHYDTFSLSSLISMVSYKFPSMSVAEEEELLSFIHLVDEISRDMNLDAPWDAANAAEFDISIYDYAIQHVTYYRAQVELFYFIQTILACEPRNCSFLFFVFYIASGGGMQALGDGTQGAQKWKLKYGAMNISKHLLNDIYMLSSSVKVLFSTVVKSINYSDISNVIVNATSYAENNISFSNVVTVTCKKVLIAVSPHLSIGKIQFTPSLPEEKYQLSHSMTPGYCMKIIVIYETPFWLGNNCDGNVIIYGTKMISDMFPMHNMFHATVGSYPALVGLVTSSTAIIFSKLSEEERRLRVVSQIDELFFQPYNDIDPSVKSIALSPLAYFEKDWTQEEFSGGCFASSFTPQTFQKYGRFLRTPLNISKTSDNSNLPNIHHNLIFWASTETSPYYYGYMEGALCAGEIAASEILESLSFDD